MSAIDRPIIITKLHRAEHGELEAHVSLGNGSVPVTRRFGSWQIENSSGLRDVLPSIAAELQRRARPFEKREKAETLPDRLPQSTERREPNGRLLQ